MMLAYSEGYDALASQSGSPYILTVLMPNYFSNGLIRRGLIGSVIALLEDHPSMVTLLYFHIVSAIMLAIAIFLVLVKVTRSNLKFGTWLGIVLVLSPQFRLWGSDIARTDMLSLAFVTFAAYGALYQRWKTAALILLIGSLAHETIVIMGAPVLLVAWYIDYRQHRTNFTAIASAVGLLAGLLASIALLQAAFPADPEQVAAMLRARIAPSIDRDLAMFITVADSARNINLSACGARLNPAYPLFIASGSLFIPFYFVLLGYRPTRMHLAIFGVAVVLPMLFLTTVATDYGRWFVMAAFNAWLCAALLTVRRDAVAMGPRLNLMVAVPALVLLIAAGRAELFYANRLTYRVAATIWQHPMSTAPMAVNMAICDPGWRDIVDGTQTAARIDQPGATFGP